MKKLLVALALTLSVTGCVFTRESSEWMLSYGRTFYEPDPGMAAVYIIRGVPDEDTSPLRVVIGQQPVVSLTGLTWTRLNLLPNFYDMRAFGDQASTQTIFTVTAGQSRFLLLEPKPGGNAELQEISQAEGRRLVRRGQPVGNTF